MSTSTERAERAAANKFESRRRELADSALAAIADTFVTVAEGGISAMSDAEFIAHLYQSGLERTASADEIAGWIKLMDDGALNRGDLLLGIADSAEMTALVGMMSTTIDVT